MPTTHEIPPNPVDNEQVEQDEREAAGAVKVRTGRFGELDEHELIHLLDTLDDERSRARFRESVYISLFVYIALGWFLFYGPQVIFHQPRLINPADAIRAHEKELTYLNLPPDVAKELSRKPTTRATEKPHPDQTPKPSLDKKTLEALRAARTPAPTKLPPTPEPAPQQAAPAAPVQPAPTPLPQRAPPQNTPLPSIDAPKPQPKANFGTGQSAGSAIQQATRGAFQPGSGRADYDRPRGGSRGNLNTPLEVLSDMQGVDFGPYLKKLLREIYVTWLPLIPEEARPPLNKQGETLIRFSILPDGRIGGMHLDDSTHDDALNRAAWGSITGVGQFSPLPSEFKGPNLELRIRYMVNKSNE